MVYKPLDEKIYLQYLKLAGWSLKKGKIDHKLYDDKGKFVCTIKRAHGKNTKEEIVAMSVQKTAREFKERNLAATKKEIKEHLKIALEEVGVIDPWFDQKYKTWVFSNDAYPVECSGDTKEEVISNYPKYLYDFIEERLNDNLSKITEKKTQGRGGKRERAGRPIGTKKEPTKRVSLPVDIADWITSPGTISHLRALGIARQC
jgi:hypothetical protein